MIATLSNNDIGGLSIIAIGFLVYYKFNPQKKFVDVTQNINNLHIGEYCKVF